MELGFSTKQEDGSVESIVYDTDKVSDEAKQRDVLARAGKVNVLTTVAEALTYVANVHRADMQIILKDFPDSIVSQETIDAPELADEADNSESESK